ncbi:MAG: lactate racemase domain-containing protein, partial [Planctomycetaceae bacterium]
MTQSLPLLSDVDVRRWISGNVPTAEFAGQRVLLIVPDTTRTAPLSLLFGALSDHLRPHAKALDILVALGTHPPMSDSAIRE